jgi:protein-L-isoaspartate(D-aspartate) O-methyltransferase
MDTTAPAAQPEVLRARMVDHIVKAGHARSTRVKEALRAVPRHEFVPAATVEEAYANEAVITKRAGNGAALSCASVPTVVAMMLDQLDVHHGDDILEIGAGTGYNAALLSCLTGPDGLVTTVDIDPEVTAQARRALEATGNGHVHVITRDGALGDAMRAPYDRVIFTVGAWDLPTAVRNQLAPGGRLVVPLRWRGQTRSVAFVRDGELLRAVSIELCGFVPMIGQDGERTAPIDKDGQVSLHWDADQPIDPAAIRGALNQPKTSAWSGATIGAGEPFDGVWLRMTGTEPDTCRIAAEPAAVDSGLCTPAVPSLSPAIVQGDSLAYFVQRRLPEEDTRPRWELGAIGHGPAGQELADRLCEQIHAWDADRDAEPVITIYPAGTPDDQLLEGLVLDKHDVRMTIFWP